MRRYLDNFDNASADEARASFNSVRKKFIDEVERAIKSGVELPGYNFDQIHHWNWFLSDNAQHALDARHLFPVSDEVHTMIHRMTTSGPVIDPMDIYLKPINPIHRIELDLSTPLAPR